MTAPELILVIPVVGVAIVSIIESIKSRKQAKETQIQSKETHDAVNSRMDKFLAEQGLREKELIKVSVAEAFAAGVKQATDTMKSVSSVAPPLAAPAAPVKVEIVPDPKKPVPVTILSENPQRKNPAFPPVP